jgi:hypothetical protein
MKRDTLIVIKGKYLTDIEADTGRLIDYATEDDKTKAMKMTHDDAYDTKYWLLEQDEELKNEDFEFDFIKE